MPPKTSERKQPDRFTGESTPTEGREREDSDEHSDSAGPDDAPAPSDHADHPVSPAPSPDETSVGGPTPLPLLLHSLGWAALLCIGLFLVLRPETFGAIPNGLDPFFYTGLGINFDDAASIGSSHYFISRWSGYYPLYLINLVTGPIAARLILRLVYATVLTTFLWRLRPQWNWGQRVLAGTLMLSMPMFVRAFFTDYVEHAFVVFLSGLIIVALRGRPDHRTSVAAGALLALTVVANPIAVLGTLAPLALLVLRANGLWPKVVRAAIIVGTAALVAIAGLLYFRWVHGLADIYEPTIEFMKSGPGTDPFKSPRLTWLGSYTWIYLPPFVVALAVLASFRSKTRLDRVEWMAVGLCAAQYPIQIADQFIRDGNGLEISYYWSIAVPSFGIALVLVVNRLLTGVRTEWAIGLVVGWIALLTVGVPTALRLPPALGFVAVAVAVLALIWVGLPRFAPATTALILAFVAWTQIGAPPYDPLAYHFHNTTPHYDKLFGPDGDRAEGLLDEAIWFEEQMESLEADQDTVFAPLGNSPNQMVAIYLPHVGSRLLALDPTTLDANTSSVPGGLFEGTYSWLAIMGDQGLVDGALDRLDDRYELDAPVLDEIYDGPTQDRLVVVPANGRLRLPARYEADALPAMQGELKGDDLVIDDPQPGFASFGPYVSLAPARYIVTLDYTSSLDPDQTDGLFDVTNSSGVVASEPIAGTDGGRGSISIGFEAEAGEGPWEFRTLVDGEADLRIDGLTLDEG